MSGDLIRAATLLGTADALRSRQGAAIPAEQTRIYGGLQAVRTRLSETAWDAAQANGRRLTAAEAVALAASPPSVHAPKVATGRLAPDDPQLLTPREREVAALIGQGLTSRQIAERLVITERTADTHAERIRSKLGLRSRAEIAAWATRHDLTS